MLSDDSKQALGVALNEASLLGLEFDPDRQLAGATFGVLSLPVDGGPMPDDRRVQFLFHDVSRLAVSLRGGHWDDIAAPVIPLTIEQLLPTVQSFGGLPIYGWEFFDTGERAMAAWGNRLSIDWHAPRERTPEHSITLFQEGLDRHLDLCLWFETLELHRPDGAAMSLEEFTAAGKRWWDAFFAKDPRTQGLGMAPLK